MRHTAHAHRRSSAGYARIRSNFLPGKHVTRGSPSRTRIRIRGAHLPTCVVLPCPRSLLLHNVSFPINGEKRMLILTSPSPQAAHRNAKEKRTHCANGDRGRAGKGLTASELHLRRSGREGKEVNERNRNVGEARRTTKRLQNTRERTVRVYARRSLIEGSERNSRHDASAARHVCFVTTTPPA